MLLLRPIPISVLVGSASLAFNRALEKPTPMTDPSDVCMIYTHTHTEIHTHTDNGQTHHIAKETEGSLASQSYSRSPTGTVMDRLTTQGERQTGAVSEPVARARTDTLMDGGQTNIEMEADSDRPASRQTLKDRPAASHTHTHCDEAGRDYSPISLQVQCAHTQDSLSRRYRDLSDPVSQPTASARALTQIARTDGAHWNLRQRDHQPAAFSFL